jgi:transposase InsO family protein
MDLSLRAGQRLEAKIADYNERYLPSALGHMPTRQFEREYYASPGTQFTVA